jgi:3-oxoacyl-[acyl-carrier protein] reductase
MDRLEGKVAVVTGASGGIGRAIAYRLALEGASLVLNFHSNRGGASQTLHLVEEAGSEGVLVQGDVGLSADSAVIVDTAVKRFGTVHILVNNAGVSADMLTMRLGEDDWDRVLDTDLKGAFLTTKAALRPMLRQRWGRIINVASVVAYTGNAGQASYASAKAGLLGLTKSVAREVATRRITANAVAPGLIDTPMTESLSEEIRKWMLGQIPMGKAGTPEDVAAGVAFLSSEEASYITGQVLKIDGGMVMV